MSTTDESEPLDEFLCRSRRCGRMMARILLSQGVENPLEIVAKIESVCLDLSVDWGVSPQAMEAGLRMYLAGAVDVLVGFTDVEDD